ncbi:MAG TPA: TetR/AcrR family transcriptional regulator [Xanthobacteraceae bacterium]|jgi:AcrR family transcriptional regulator|nr:TetR/AcrR family transcriptional regulator [Xanthobacteraceae bacterium]
MTAPLVLDRPAEETEDSAKRRQIIEGARTVFRALGFDAASMGEIAKAAGVSKGTLYVYFKDKDELFKAIIQKECPLQAEGVFDLDGQRVFELDPADPDVAGTLTRLGIAFMKALCEPERQSTLRTVWAIADRKPDIGRTFYETGPARGLANLRAYLEAQAAAGRLAPADYEVAAAQFIESCHATMLKPMMLNFAPPPSPERIEYVVGIAVKTFMAAYGKK